MLRAEMYACVRTHVLTHTQHNTRSFSSYLAPPPETPGPCASLSEEREKERERESEREKKRERERERERAREFVWQSALPKVFARHTTPKGQLAAFKLVCTTTSWFIQWLDGMLICTMTGWYIQRLQWLAAFSWYIQLVVGLHNTQVVCWYVQWLVGIYNDSNDSLRSVGEYNDYIPDLWQSKRPRSRQEQEREKETHKLTRTHTLIRPRPRQWLEILPWMMGMMWLTKQSDSTDVS